MVFDGSHADSNSLNSSAQQNDLTLTCPSSNGSTGENNMNLSSFQNNDVSHCRHINHSHAINNGLLYGQTPDHRETQSRKSYKDDTWHLDYLASASTTAETLNDYEYLNDFEYCPIKYRRLKQNALKKFDLILRSIKSNHCDLFESASGSDSDSGLLDEPAFECSNFNLILKRHRKRIKTQRSNSTSHHRR